MKELTIHHSPFTIYHFAGLFLVLAAFFVLTMGGHTYSSDEETLFATSEALAQQGQFNFTQANNSPTVQGFTLPDGSAISKYGPLKPLLQVPLYWLGNVAAGGYPPSQHAFITRLYVGIFNPLVQAAIAALLFLFATRLGYRQRVGLFIALLYAFATFAWPHSRTQFAEPLSALLLFASLYFAWRGLGQQGVVNPAPKQDCDVAAQFNALASGQQGAINPAPTADVEPQPIPPPTHHSSLITHHSVSGLLMAAALATKLQNGLVLPIILAYVVWLGWQHRNTMRWWLMPAAWLGGFAIGYIPLGLYNLRYFGGPFSSGYTAVGETDFFSYPFGAGLFNLLLSPGKGLLWFALPILLLPFAIPRFWRQQQALAVACLAVLLIHPLFYANLSAWHGDGSWGPRYLMPALPFAILPLAPLIAALWAGGPQRALIWLGRSAVIFLVAISVSVQLFGAAVNFDTYLNATVAQFHRNTTAADNYRYYTTAGSPIFGQPRWFADRWAEWQPNLDPPADAVALVSGFTTSEGKAGAPLPRWTTGTGIIYLPSSATSLTLTLADYRPPNLPRASVQVIAAYGTSNAHVVAAQPAANGAVSYRLIPNSGGAQQIAIVSDTWNPASTGIARDETLGMDVLGLTTAPSLPTVGAAIIPMPQQNDREQFYWFYRSDIHHLIDAWQWYAAQSGLSPAQQDDLARPIYISCAAMFILGLLCAFLPRSNHRLATPPTTPVLYSSR